MATQSNPKKSAGTPIMPVADVIGRVDDELRDLAGLVADLDSSTLRRRADDGSIDRTYLRQMQNIDLVSQKLAGLADFLTALRAAMPSQWLLDPSAALQIVKLQELAVKLGHQQDGADEIDEIDASDCDFF